MDAGTFNARFGVRPAQFADYLALVGDPVDDIPGVPGVGAKTAPAASVFRQSGCAGQGPGRVPDLEMRGAAGLAKRLQAHWPQVLLARQLTGLHEQVPEVVAVPGFVLQSSNIEAAIAFLDELGIGEPLAARPAATPAGGQRVTPLVLADENIPGVQACLGPRFRVEHFEGRRLTPDRLAGADALLVRSVTRVNATLL
ncbi:MAG: 5'-3' exonuclease H3TH domain-containing protein [Halioglobus sp.]